MDRNKFSGGCDWFHPPQHYADYAKANPPGTEPAAPKAKAKAEPKDKKKGARLASGAKKEGDEDCVVYEDGGSDGEAEDSVLSLVAAGLRDLQPALRALKVGYGASLDDRINVLAEFLGVPVECKTMTELPDDQCTLRENPRHPGYHAFTRVVMSRLAVPLLLDSGATTSALMEEAVMAIIAETMRAVTEDGMTAESPLYPIVRIYRYSNAKDSPLSGVMADKQAITVHAISLRVQFVPAPLARMLVRRSDICCPRLP